MLYLILLHPVLLKVRAIGELQQLKLVRIADSQTPPLPIGAELAF